MKYWTLEPPSRLLSFLALVIEDERDVGELRRLEAERLVELDVFRGVRKVVLTANDVGDFHLDVVDHVDEVENPRAIRAADRHVGVGRRVGHVKLDAAADEVLDEHALAGRAEADRALVLVEVAALLEDGEVLLVNGVALALAVRAVVASLVRTFIPIEPEPGHAIIDGLDGLGGVALVVGILHAEDESAAEATGVEPVKKGRAGASDVEVAGGRGSKTGANRHESGKCSRSECAGFAGKGKSPSRGNVGERAAWIFLGTDFRPLHDAGMSLQAQVDNDIKDAMRAKDMPRLNTLRLLKAALKNTAIEKGGADAVLDDVEASAVIRKQVKQRQDSIEGFEKGGRPELAANEKAEIEILSAYLPKALSAEELAVIVRDAIAEAGATTRQQMGAVMKIASAKAAGRADGKALSSEVQKQLS